MCCSYLIGLEKLNFMTLFHYLQISLQQYIGPVLWTFPEDILILFVLCYETSGEPIKINKSFSIFGAVLPWRKWLVCILQEAYENVYLKPSHMLVLKTITAQMIFLFMLSSNFTTASAKFFNCLHHCNLYQWLQEYFDIWWECRIPHIYPYNPMCSTPITGLCGVETARSTLFGNTGCAKPDKTMNLNKYTLSIFSSKLIRSLIRLDYSKHQCSSLLEFVIIDSWALLLTKGMGWSQCFLRRLWKTWKVYPVAWDRS